MSGGSYDYAYGRIESLAYEIAKNARTPERKAFVTLLSKVARAAKAIEWVDSGDGADEFTAIHEALGENHRELCLVELINEAKIQIETLKEYTK